MLEDMAIDIHVGRLMDCHSSAGNASSNYYLTLPWPSTTPLRR